MTAPPAAKGGHTWRYTDMEVKGQEVCPTQRSVLLWLSWSDAASRVTALVGSRDTWSRSEGAGAVNSICTVFFILRLLILRSGCNFSSCSKGTPSNPQRVRCLALPKSAVFSVVTMASAALELMGFFLGLLGMLGTLVATVLPYWQISAHIGSNIVTAVANMRGLWMECVYQSTGAFQCETYNSMLALSPDLQASRALMVISLVLSVLAVAVAALGMQCTLCLEGAGAAKSRVAGASGGLFLTAGFLSLIPVSWTTHEVVQTFYRPDLPSSMKFELGECLYVGLASSLVTMLGGGMLSASCCEEQGGGRRHAGGYPYPVGVAVPGGGARTTSQTYHNPTLQAGASRGPAMVRSTSHSSQSTAHGAQGAKKPAAAGYDITGYV
uniref:Claudin n=1 Tax=Gasterosteus aculeatus aculeatus TaxID=481459 RepID=A0AAQ4NSN4_GASAC|nr:claudin-2 isoform X3 [Gasterosteus aculeatus aculeatus]